MRRHNPDKPRWDLVQKHAPVWAKSPISDSELAELLEFLDLEGVAETITDLAELFEQMGNAAAARNILLSTKVRYAMRQLEIQAALTADQQAKWAAHAISSALKAGDVTQAEVDQAIADYRAAQGG